jgi:hypothetical protein
MLHQAGLVIYSQITLAAVNIPIIEFLFQWTTFISIPVGDGELNEEAFLIAGI